jgi:hypothetical protein
MQTEYVLLGESINQVAICEGCGRVELTEEQLVPVPGG